MLKLKNLFPNFDLATMLVENWDYDSLDLFKYWRISANAIYPFKSEDKVCFLRFAPVDEKEKTLIEAELEFLLYLKRNNYKAIEPKLSKHGRFLEVVNTPWGKYYAVVFKRVSGMALEGVELTDKVAFLWGKNLGRLHNLSKAYKPTGEKRLSYEDQFQWIKEVIADFKDENDAVKEAKILEEFFKELPKTEENFGLVHFDYELDNVFYDEETKTISPIDFDDAMYHWYAMDIEQTFDSIRDELPSEKAEDIIEQFLKGYRTEHTINEEMINLLPVFHRFANLYGYVRVLRSVEEKWDNEPEWLEVLRGKLNNKLVDRKSMFGREIG